MDEILLTKTLADFCQANDRGRCFAGWPRKVLEDYLAFHMEQATLAYVRSAGQIVALAVGWQCNEAQVRQPGFVDTPFRWQPTDPKGDCVFFGPLVCIQPEARRALVDEFRIRWPQWRRLKLFAGRRGKLKEYPTGFLDRLAGARIHALPSAATLGELAGFAECWERARRIVAEYRALLPAGVELRCDGGGGSGPAPRDLYAETAGELQAKLDLAPKQYAAEAEFRPQYAQLDLQSIRDLLLGTQAGKRTVQTTQYRNAPGQKVFLPGGQVAPTGYTLLPGQGNAGMTGFRQEPGAYGAGGGGQWWQGPDVQTPYQQSSEIDVAAQPGLVSLLGQARDAANPRNAQILGLLNDSALSALGGQGGLTPEELRASAVGAQGAWGSRGLGMSPGAAISQSIAQQSATRQRLMENRAFGAGVLGLNQANDPVNALLGQSGALSQSFGPQLFGSSINANDVYNTNYNAAAARDISAQNNSAAMQSSAIGGGLALGSAVIIAA